MSDTSHLKCPRCGKELPPSAPEGLCPACLGALNFATETNVTGADAKEALPPMTPAELAPHFPQLEILECLGRGGMGVVYKAKQKSLNRLVALKLLAPERVQDAKFAERFAKEAQALALLNHPNIVTVHDFGQAGGFYFLLMEFVDGVNLRQLLHTRKLQPTEALAIVPPVCEALQFAHEHGIVHRDIKPENLLLAKDGRVKIADFGIAKIMGSEVSAASISLASSGGEGQGEEAPSSAATQQTTMGTPQYMAPEQREQPQIADHRADIYSLGVVLYELLTGELPASQLQPPSSRVRGIQIDVRLDEIVLRALEKTPELRYQTAGEFKTQVETVSGAASASPPSGAKTQPLLKAGRCYLTTREKLGTATGQMFLYRDKAELVLDDRQIAFIEADKTTVIPLAAIRDLSIGRFPLSVNPAGLDFISLAHEENGQSRELIFAPCESLFGSPAGFNEYVAEWHASIRHAVQAATGLVPPGRTAAEPPAGTRFSFVPAVLLLLAALIVPLMWFSVDRQIKQAEAMTHLSRIQSAQSQITQLNQRLGEAHAAWGRAASRAGDTAQSEVTRRQAREEQAEHQRRADSLSREIAQAQRALAKLSSQSTVPQARYSLLAVLAGAGLGIAGLVALSRALRSTGNQWSFGTLVAFVASLFAAAIALTVFLQTFRLGTLETLLILGVLIFLFGKSGVMTRWPMAGWMRLLAWMDFILAIPVIILGVFFLIQILRQADDWHPTPAEALAVPLTWLAAVLLPWAAMRLRRPVVASADVSGPEKRSPVMSAIMAVTFYAGLVLGILLIGMLSFRFSRDSAYLLLVGLMAVTSPFVGMLVGRALRQAEQSQNKDRLEQLKGRLKGLSIVAWILALPVIGFAIFFFIALLSSTGGWNPAVSEAVLVPLTWLGAGLLPWAALRLRRASQEQMGDFPAKQTSGSAIFLGVVALVMALMLLLGFALLITNANRVKNAEVVAREAAERKQQESKRWATTVHELAGPPFIAQLPYGGSIELLAVRLHPGNTNQPWWRPDGSPSPYGPDITIERANDLSGGVLGLAKIKWPQPPESKEAYGVTMNGGRFALKDGLRLPLEEYSVIHFENVVARGDEATLSLSVGVREWETLVTMKPGRAKVKEWEFSTTANGNLKLSAKQLTQQPGAEYRLVVLDTAGKLHTPISFKTTTTTGSLASEYEAVFDGIAGLRKGLRPDEVKEVYWQQRPLDSIEFSRVSLKPGHRTKLSVRDFVSANDLKAENYPGDWIWEANSDTLSRVPPMLLIRESTLPNGWAPFDMFGKDRYLARGKTLEELMAAAWSQKDSSMRIVLESGPTETRFDFIVTGQPHWWESLRSELIRRYRLSEEKAADAQGPFIRYKRLPETVAQTSKTVTTQSELEGSSSSSTSFKLPTRLAFPVAPVVLMAILAAILVGGAVLLVWVSRKHGAKGCLLAGAIIMFLGFLLVICTVLLSFWGYRGAQQVHSRSAQVTQFELKPNFTQSTLPGASSMPMQVQNGLYVQVPGGQLITFEVLMRQADDSLQPLPTLTTMVATGPGRSFEGTVFWTGKRWEERTGTNQVWQWAVNGHEKGSQPYISRSDYETNITYQVSSAEPLHWWMPGMPQITNMTMGEVRDIPLFRSFGPATLDGKQPKEAILRVKREALPADYKLGAGQYQLLLGVDVEALQKTKSIAAATQTSGKSSIMLGSATLVQEYEQDLRWRWRVTKQQPARILFSLIDTDASGTDTNIIPSSLKESLPKEENWSRPKDVVLTLLKDGDTSSLRLEDQFIAPEPLRPNTVTSVIKLQSWRGITSQTQPVELSSEHYQTLWEAEVVRHSTDGTIKSPRRLRLVARLAKPESSQELWPFSEDDPVKEVKGLKQDDLARTPASVSLVSKETVELARKDFERSKLLMEAGRITAGEATDAEIHLKWAEAMYRGDVRAALEAKRDGAAKKYERVKLLAGDRLPRSELAKAARELAEAEAALKQFDLKEAK